ncbi:hypothetical protein UCMB321_3882 [Pseudomonas batumici]|uniref:Tyrosine-protein kinase G-rich domain-containing protein n=1 Tax=Pseudomonas batumici TaxID=226910 RepID=A0A0C2EUU4_9PSED|nr:hypothetical protein UCMB321_3882 [Pseudomonas batumici]
MRDLQERYSFFKGLKIEPAVVSVYRQDGVVELPDKPVKPNKALILVLGVIAGLITGIAFVLLRGLFVVRPE